MVAPAGAPVSENVNVCPGRSASVADAVKAAALPSLTEIGLVIIARTGFWLDSSTWMLTDF